MKTRVFSLFLCLALLLGALPLTAGAAADFCVLEIPVTKTVRVDRGEPGDVTFTLDYDLSAVQTGTEIHVSSASIPTSGAGDYGGVFRFSVPTEEDFWNLTEGFTLRERNDGLDGWTYDNTEWCVVPYMHENDPGTVPEKEPRVAFYNLTAGDVPDYVHGTGSRSEIRLTNVYAGPEPEPTPVPTPEVPEDLEFRIPYAKTVVNEGTGTVPARDFRLILGGLPDTALDFCEITGDTIATRGAGSYSGDLVIRPRSGDALAALANGFTVTEELETDPDWSIDPAEWYVAVTERSPGSYSFSLYNLSEGDEPGVSPARSALDFTNYYVAAPAPTPTPIPTPADPVRVTYDPNGGSVTDPVETVRRGETVTLNRLPSRDGWSFLGWFETKDSGQRLVSLRPETDTTVYAHWRQTPVPAVLNGGDHGAYVIGYEDGSVRPLNMITRAEVTMIFFRLLKPEVRDAYRSQTNGFGDVAPEAWYNEAVSTMARLGILKGRSDTVFDPNAPITRAEYAAICARFDTSEVPELAQFNDIAGHWAEKEIRHAAAIGWVKGYDDGSFQPNRSITRAESMTLTNRVLQRLPGAVTDLLADMRSFPDNADPAVWYYLAVQEATNAHTYEKRGDGHESWTALLDS